MAKNLFSLQNKIALITGASSGIGAHIATGLAKEGASVIVAARRKDRLEDLVNAIEAEGGTAMAVSMDVTDKVSITEAFNDIENRLGIIEVIINNAGVSDPKNFLEIEDASLDFVMDTNFKGVWHVAQEGAKRMVAAGCAGNIINISSILALGILPGQSSYAASKAAIMQLTRSMAIDLMRHNIRVNAIAPGSFKTEINEDFYNSPEGEKYIQQLPAKRIGHMEEILGPVILLASQAGSYINGAIIPVDGAHHVRLI